MEVCFSPLLVLGKRKGWSTGGEGKGLGREVEGKGRGREGYGWLDWWSLTCRVIS